MTMRGVLFTTILALLTTPGFAQSQPQIDPRISTPMIEALRAEVALRDAALKVMQEDAERLQQRYAYAERLAVWGLWPVFGSIAQPGK